MKLFSSGPDRAAALVIMLVFIVLISAFVVSFFSAAQTEFRAAQSYAGAVSAHQLAESAVSVVMSQVREATSRPNAAWGSQAGMIRVYRSGEAASDEADAFFKLYSSDDMIVSGATEITNFDPENEVPVGASDGWNHQPALFTDLNEPVASVSGALRYPIVHPEAKGLIEGFDLVEDPADDSDRPARMPVRWLYVLKDGSLTAPAKVEENGQRAVWEEGPHAPRPENPIVGRIAFWADDETCKVNINTAGGFSTKDLTNYDEKSYPGSFWDTPRTLTDFDRGKLNPDGSLRDDGGGLALCQPVRNEFQRYPGHPATTSLGLVLQQLLSSEQLYALAPRLSGGGSLGGTNRLLSATEEPLPRKVERLYASVDELFYAPQMNGGARVANDTALELSSGTLTPELLEKLQFFLTAHSRSPELNLYGRPRVTIWPLHTELNQRNTPDNLLAFCSTIGSDRRLFMFQRKDPYSPTVDAQIERNIELYDYLRELTSKPVPGFGSSFLEKYQGDRDQILAEIFDYIRCVNMRDSTRDKPFNLLAEPFKTREKEKFKFAPRGIVVPIRFERDGGNAVGFGRFPTISEASLVLYHAGYVGNDGKRYRDPEDKEERGVKANLVRAFMIFETFNPLQGYAPTMYPSGHSLERRPIVFEIEGLDQFAVSAGDVPMPLGFKSGVLRNEYLLSSVNTWGGRNSGGSEGFMHPIFWKVNRNEGTPTSYQFQTAGLDTDEKNDDGSDKDAPGIEIPADQTSLQLTGAELQLRIGFGPGPAQIRALTLTFPDAVVPAPTDEVWDESGGYHEGGADWGVNPRPTAVKSFAERLAWAQLHSYNPWVYNAATNPLADDKRYVGRWRSIVQPGDIIRSLVFAGEGDLRVSALTDDGSVFRPHPKYSDSTWRHAQTLRRADGVGIYMSNGKGTHGTVMTTKFGNIVKLPPGRVYPPAQSADLPENLVDGVLREDGQAGDFDTGIGNLADGPFCGKADEGNLSWRTWNANLGDWVYHHPYFTWAYDETYDTFFTPNRQVPSAGLFGSLLAGRYSDWQTLCFSPNPAGQNHPGRQVKPRDHLLLDLWHMPVVEPFAISEPWSTDGKVNCNYPIVPFNHIKRSTGLRAALHSVRVTAFPSVDVNTYKTGLVAGKNYRYVVDRDETLEAFDDFFKEYERDHRLGFLKSASEICNFYLYPKGSTNTGVVRWSNDETGIQTFWAANTLTGDNVREKPYADLYPRLTTKSNAYTVHIRAQALRQPVPSESDPAKRAQLYRQWNETSGGIIGEYRGCSTIERYIDPDDRRFNKAHPETVQRGDYIDVDKEPLEDAYRFRVALTKRFAP
ncbi:MAG: Verru_Chthon cassette protein A [Verrucomicrobiota bacterium]|nr:Verru_Chthon cassette protein A [Verrucomicrobiota bacterium]